MNRRNLLIIISVLLFIALVGGISYSYFVYNKDVGIVSLETGDISINLSDVSGNQTLSNVIPQSDTIGKASANYFDFTVDATVDSEKIYYEIYILPKTGNTLDTSYLKTYLTDQNDVEIKGVRLYDSLSEGEVEDGKVIYKDVVELNNNYTSKTETKDFRLRLWLDDSYNEQTSKTFEFDVYVYGKNVPEDFAIDGASMVKNAISAKEAQGGTCGDITYEEDGITYLSGTNDCVDMNYVWYSGKLWRITAIYPDGAMKLVTENNITSITFNVSTFNASGIDFYTNANDTSYVYQWLNEDFYDTLYNPTNFIDTTKQWNATNSNASSNSNISTKLSETTMVTDNVGLLNSYDYYNSYRKLGSYSNGYLNIGYYWWLLNPYNGSYVWNVSSDGLGYKINPYYARGIRPSIYLKPGVEFIGTGTKQSPYKVVGDKDVGLTNDLINTRLSGEYVKLVNSNNSGQYQLFRIISVEDNKTKIIAMDYADNKASRQFAVGNSSGDGLIYGSGQTSTIGENTWYNYLTGTYYPSLVTIYGQLFDSSTYYMGQVGDRDSYKLGICQNVNSNTKNCTKTNQIGTFNIGLPRYGEMFATLQDSVQSLNNSMWFITPYSSAFLWTIDYYGVDYNEPTSTFGARPTVHLKSTVKIISGTGTETDPYVVGL